jgi:hypothetical protein
MDISARTKRRALKARDKIDKMRREWRQWKGEEMTVARVNHGDFLALTEVGWIKDGKLSGSELEVLPG